MELCQITAKLTTHHEHIHGMSLQQQQQQNKITMFQVILVGFLPNDNGWSCALHPFGCCNALVLATSSHGVGMHIRLHLVKKSHLTGYKILADGPDGCRICLAAWENDVGACGQNLEGAVAAITEIVIPDDANFSRHAIFHRNCGYVFAELPTAVRMKLNLLMTWTQIRSQSNVICSK